MKLIKRLFFGSTSTPFLMIARVFFVLIFTYIINSWIQVINIFILDQDVFNYTFLGFLIAVLFVFFESQIKEVYPQYLLMGLLGLLLGLSTASLICIGLPESATMETRDIARVCLFAFLGYFGSAIGLRYAHRMDFIAAKYFKNVEDRLYGSKVLDTSVLIDGRIMEVIEAGFMNGLLVIPSFVIDELQTLSDSTDHMKRSKGRRGLDISKRLQNSTSCEVDMVTENFPNIEEVDKKLLAFCHKYEAALVTMDFNLNKVADLDDIRVMNINLLAQSLKTVVLPGEKLLIQVLREGKESGQGIGYLEDGTMVVVEEGKRLIGKAVDVVVASVLQTSAGRMVFTKPATEDDVPAKSA
jgi:uncharacterized protein YacL